MIHFQYSIFFSEIIVFLHCRFHQTPQKEFAVKIPQGIKIESLIKSKRIPTLFSRASISTESSYEPPARNLRPEIDPYKIALVLADPRPPAIRHYLSRSPGTRGDGAMKQSLSCDEVVPRKQSHITYVKADAKDKAYLTELLNEKFDVIVDFLIYTTQEFRDRYDLLLQSTGHYIFLSTYRVYDGKETPITENSPRLLDASNDKEFLATEDYSLYKAREEDLLQKSNYNQLDHRSGRVTLNSKPAVPVGNARSECRRGHRAFERNARSLFRERLFPYKPPCMGGDVAKMFFQTPLKSEAQRECFTLATGGTSHGVEIADIIRKSSGWSMWRWITEDYLKILGLYDVNPHPRYPTCLRQTV